MRVLRGPTAEHRVETKLVIPSRERPDAEQRFAALFAAAGKDMPDLRDRKAVEHACLALDGCTLGVTLGADGTVLAFHPQFELTGTGHQSDDQERNP